MIINQQALIQKYFSKSEQKKSIKKLNHFFLSFINLTNDLIERLWGQILSNSSSRVKRKIRST